VSAPAEPADGPYALADLLASGGVVVLSGAGMSTESGIPDYRGPTGADRRGDPITYQTFTTHGPARQRYWARSYAGWPLFSRAAPNAGHTALARLEAAGLISGVVTQNVDGLHQRAGSRRVIDLHGRLDRVACLGCGRRSDRRRLQARLAAANTGWDGQGRAVVADGDMELDRPVDDFVMVDCATCGGMLKPDVVFFGESVPAPRVRESFDLVATARVLLVLGSSLTVYSGRRFVVSAAARGATVAIINDGPTRCDDAAQLRLHDRLGPTLAAVATELA